jgi:hypothetical protein
MSKAHPLENDVKAEIKKLLDLHGWTHWPNAASPYGVVLVDRHAVRGTRDHGCLFLAIEAKLDKPKGTVLQEKHLADVRAQGGMAVVVNRKNIGKFAELLERISAAYPKP